MHCNLASQKEMILFLCVGIVCLGPCWAVEHTYHDYLVIGAGPSGLQMGYFLQRANRDYAILERANVSGSFYLKYPRHDKLISINKRNTGKTNKEFNLRHDWNSLLSDDESLLFRHYSQDLFPHRSTMLDYLRDYKDKLNLKVIYNTDLREIHRMEDTKTDNMLFSMTDQDENVFSCKSLILAVGLSKANQPRFEGSDFVESYETVSVNASHFEAQSVLILGRGNSAFEVAERIYGSTNLIHMLSRSRVRLAWETHYVGDLRAVNTQLLDTYQLKSLDGILEAPIEAGRIVKRNKKLYMELVGEDGAKFDNFALREPYDRIISCMGWVFDDGIFSKGTNITKASGRLKKFPLIGHNYESLDHKNLYFAGTVTHSVDFRKSAGGFIHGFRYTTRALHHLLEWKNHQVKWPSVHGYSSDLLNHLVKRINEASGLYQMFYMLGDIIVFNNNRQTYDYLEEFPVHLLHELSAHTGHETEEVIVVVLEYGSNFSGPGKDIFRPDRATGEPSEAHQSNFLHPVFYFYKALPSAEAMMNVRKPYNLPRPDRIHHLVEDFLTNWDALSSHILPLRRFIEKILDKDTRHFGADDCFYMAMTMGQIAPACAQGYLEDHGLGILSEHSKDAQAMYGME